MANKYDKKVTVSLTTADYNTLVEIQGSSRLTVGQLASTMVEEGIQTHQKTTATSE